MLDCNNVGRDRFNMKAPFTFSKGNGDLIKGELKYWYSGNVGKESKGKNPTGKAPLGVKTWRAESSPFESEGKTQQSLTTWINKTSTLGTARFRKCRDRKRGPLLSKTDDCISRFPAFKEELAAVVISYSKVRSWQWSSRLQSLEVVEGLQTVYVRQTQLDNGNNHCHYLSPKQIITQQYIIQLFLITHTVL